MQKFSKFLFYYSLLFSAVIFLNMVLFARNVENILFFIFFLPITVYLWTAQKQGNEENTKPEGKTRLIIAILFLTGSALFLTSSVIKTRNETPENPVLTLGVSETQQLTQKGPQSETPSDLAQQLSETKDELVKIRAELRAINQILGISKSAEELAEIITSLDSTLGSQSETKTLGYITISDPTLLNTNLFKEPSASAITVGKIKYGQNYPFTEKQGGWYRVILEDSTGGWISSQWVKETNQ